MLYKQHSSMSDSAGGGQTSEVNNTSAAGNGVTATGETLTTGKWQSLTFPHSDQITQKKEKGRRRR